MVTVVLDTSIVIDLLQGYPPAVVWQQTRTDNSTEFLLAAIICMEVVEGTTNKRELEKTLRFLRKFSWVETASTDLDWAFDRYTAYYLSHGVGWQDCIIAAPCYRLKLTLYTRNLKHFTPLLGELAVAPY